MDSTDKVAIRGYYGRDVTQESSGRRSQSTNIEDESSSSKEDDEDQAPNFYCMNVKNIADTVIFIS